MRRRVLLGDNGGRRKRSKQLCWLLGLRGRDDSGGRGGLHSSGVYVSGRVLGWGSGFGCQNICTVRCLFTGTWFTGTWFTGT